MISLLLKCNNSVDIVLGIRVCRTNSSVRASSTPRQRRGSNINGEPQK